MDTSTGDLATDIRMVLERFGELVAGRDMAVVAEFAPAAEVLLIGSEIGEEARGHAALHVFLARVFAGPASIRWSWDRVDVAGVGEVAWVYAEGQVVVTREGSESRAPYRLTGVFQNVAGRWKWRHFHGAEPR